MMNIMKIDYKKFGLVRIFQFDSEKQVGSLKNVLFEAKNGKVILLKIKLGRIIYYLKPQGFISFEKKELILVKDYQKFLVTKKKISGVNLIKMGVFDENRVFQGRVFNFTVDSNLLILESIESRFTFLGFGFRKKIFGWKQILNIFPHKIIVKSSRPLLNFENKKQFETA